MRATPRPVRGRPRTQPRRARAAAPRTIRIASELGASFREELERIVFFNPEQPTVATRVIEIVQRYGIPSIVEEAGRLRFTVRAFGPLQTLYALDESRASPRLVGVVMFTRESTASMIVLHLAVHEEYSSHGKYADTAVVVRLVAAVRDAALRTHGVRRLRFLYPHEIRLHLHRRPRPALGDGQHPRRRSRS